MASDDEPASPDGRAIIKVVGPCKSGKSTLVAGLTAAGIQRVVATGAARVVLVSCDAASLGRDTAGLVSAGYAHVESVVVDMFGHTGHVEVVTRFDRSA